MTKERQSPRLGPAGGVAMAVLSLCLTAQAVQTYNILLSFNGSDGYAPTGGVTVDQDGTLYGATGNGGTGKCPNGCGVIFKLAPGPNHQWAETILHSFQGQPDGVGSAGSVAISSGGELYGTTNYGGNHDGGTVWSLTREPGGWSEEVLYSFCRVGECPHIPQSGVTMGSDGKLYGTAFQAYELAPAQDGWKESTLYGFEDEAYGYDPFAGLIADSSGNLYGTTEVGGKKCGSSTCGTVYELSKQPNGKWRHTVLFSFDGLNGQFPGPGALYMDKTGALYGTTEIGGDYSGVIFELAPGPSHWNFDILYQFQPGATGNSPYSGVVMDVYGNLYGTTDSGGDSSGCGVLYKLAPVGNGKWQYSVLHTFGGPGDGCLPGPLAIDQHGNLYGSLIFGGQFGYGAIFEYSPAASAQ
jgi:uncharacterized repeat protein (TIGR03803 family)